MSKLEFPISIALVGAPGSGKQETYEQFKAIADSWFDGNKSVLNVIPNPGNVIADDLDTAVGLFGGWKEDLRVFFRRYEQEQQLQAENKSYITLGSALENLAHCGVNMENIMRQIQTEQQQQELQVQQITMTTLTYLFLSTFRYTFAFYLPKNEKAIVLPGVDDNEANYDKRVDDALKMVFANFGIRMQVLQGTVEENASKMLSTIRDIWENGPEELTGEAPGLVDDGVPSEESVTLSE